MSAIDVHIDDVVLILNSVLAFLFDGRLVEAEISHSFGGFHISASYDR